MKTAISLPDEVFKKVERKARQMGLSRSEFFVRAAERFLESMNHESVTASYNEAFASEDRATETFRRKATRAALLGVEWKE